MLSPTGALALVAKPVAVFRGRKEALPRFWQSFGRAADCEAAPWMARNHLLPAPRPGLQLARMKAPIKRAAPRARAARNVGGASGGTGSQVPLATQPATSASNPTPRPPTTESATPARSIGPIHFQRRATK